MLTFSSFLSSFDRFIPTYQKKAWSFKAVLSSIAPVTPNFIPNTNLYRRGAYSE